MKNVVGVTPADLAFHLAKRKLKPKRANQRRSTSREEVSEDFLRNFSATTLLAALVDTTKTRIDIGWIVKRFLEILDSPMAKDADRIQILDRLRDLLVLGAIQDESVAEEITRRLSGTPPKKEDIPDPFVKKPLKLKRIS